MTAATSAIRLNVACRTIPGKTLSVSDRIQASTQPNATITGSDDDEAVREAEEEADAEDRRPPPEPFEQRVAEPAVRQLLDERDQRADDDRR